MKIQQVKNIKEKELLDYIESSIIEFGQKFINTKNRYAFFATEDSVKCYIYSLIARNKEFLKDFEYICDNGLKITTWPLHSELNTFSKVNSKVGRFDLCIINPFDYGSKDNLACIEIEWVADMKDSYKELESVLNKLSNPKNEVESGFLIILNDNQGFTPDDVFIIRKLKQKYPEIKFFIFDAIKNAKYKF